ncbi:hypothetical protein BJ944DRAFT_272717 [Cunninghamella echinulata]|nr:hypothetical protein BJ944DRAFT_272717 [Cunninghamella echinulata]
MENEINSNNTVKYEYDFSKYDKILYPPKKKSGRPPRDPNLIQWNPIQTDYKAPTKKRKTLEKTDINAQQPRRQSRRGKGTSNFLQWRPIQLHLPQQQSTTASTATKPIMNNKKNDNNNNSNSHNSTYIGRIANNKYIGKHIRFKDGNFIYDYIGKESMKEAPALPFIPPSLRNKTFGTKEYTKEIRNYLHSIGKNSDEYDKENENDDGSSDLFYKSDYDNKEEEEEEEKIKELQSRLLLATEKEYQNKKEYYDKKQQLKLDLYHVLPSTPSYLLELKYGDCSNQEELLVNQAIDYIKEAPNKLNAFSFEMEYEKYFSHTKELELLKELDHWKNKLEIMELKNSNLLNQL